MIIGLDVGGTHTDAVLLNHGGLKSKVKVVTNASDLFNTVLLALTALLKDTDTKKIKRIVLSTTLTTNAVVQNEMEPVGIIISSGPGIDPELFRTHDHFYPVAGSIDHRGREREPVNLEEIKKISAELKMAGIKNLGVIGKFSTRNPAHENQIKEIMAHDFKKIFLGHRVSGNLNFPRRIATTHLNAAIFDIHRNFFKAVKKSLEQKGLTIPIQILKADGGTMSLDSSMDFPGQSILSGPAASVMGSIAHAPSDKDTLILDIGGTTTDIAILVDKAPLLEPVGITRGGYKSLIRSLKTYSIGLGGDSSVVLEAGKIKIGPQRAGPAMGFGGGVPTVSDALICLGIMTSGDKDKARAGVKKIADKLKISVEDASEKIMDKSCAIILAQAYHMVNKINSKPVYTVHDFLEGYKINIQSILLLGGPARLFKKKIQEISNIETTAIPNHSVANAIGAALARTTCEVSLLVDTEQGKATAPEEDFTQSVSSGFTEDEAVEIAYNLLQKKAVQAGSDPENFEAEVIEFQKFNLIRGFSPKGKIFRTKIQVKPGLIRGYHA